MDLKCKECGEEFSSKKAFHCHLKAHELRVGDYYVKHFPRFDRLTKLQLPYKRYEQYFLDDFSCFENFITWIDSGDFNEVRDYLLARAKDKFQHKNIKVSPPNLYYHLSKMADIRDYQRFFNSYSDFLDELKVKKWYNKRLPEDFWDRNCDDIRIFVDTREKLPFNFKNSLENKLDFGDYTAGGDFYTKTFIDRKSQDDFRQTFGKDIERFRREMDRCVSFNCYMFVVVESSIDKIESDNKASKFRSNLCYLWHNVRALLIDYPENIQIIFAHSRSGAQKLIPKILYYGDKLWNVDLQYYVDKKIYGMGQRPTKIST